MSAVSFHTAASLAAGTAWHTLVSDDQRGGGGDCDRGGVRRPAALPRLVVLPHKTLTQSCQPLTHDTVAVGDIGSQSISLSASEGNAGA